MALAREMSWSLELLSRFLYSANRHTQNMELELALKRDQSHQTLAPAARGRGVTGVCQAYVQWQHELGDALVALAGGHSARMLRVRRRFPSQLTFGNLG